MDSLDLERTANKILDYLESNPDCHPSLYTSLTNAAHYLQLSVDRIMMPVFNSSDGRNE